MRPQPDTAAPFDLAAYFERVGFDGPGEPTLATLESLHALHPQAIAFENVDVFAGHDVPLDPQALQHKLVFSGRGGWCFEQNLLFGGVLAQLGFRVRQLAARVLWNAPSGVVRPRTHMVLLVDLEANHYVVDVGFGGLTATAPLLLAPGLEQSTSHETFRVLEIDEEYLLEARVQEDWRPLYAFDLQAQTVADYSLTNWYLAHHPESSFRQHLLAARVAPGCRYAVFDDELTIHRPGIASERRRLTDVGALQTVLIEQLKLRLPRSAVLDDAFARIFERRRAQAAV